MARLVKKTTQPEADFLPNVFRIAELCASFKALDIRAYDVRELTVVADCFLLCSASSEPQFKAIARGVKDGMREVGVKPISSEGELSGGWIVIDYGGIIVHVFREESREFYDLDGLCGDASVIELDLEP